MSEPVDNLGSIVDEFVCEGGTIDPRCPFCGGCGYVCEEHPAMPWEPMHGLGCDCGAAGMPCKDGREAN